MMTLLEKIKDTKIKCIKIRIKDNYPYNQESKRSKLSWIASLWNECEDNLVIKYKDAGFHIEYDDNKTITINKI